MIFGPSFGRGVWQKLPCVYWQCLHGGMLEILSVKPQKHTHIPPMFMFILNMVTLMFSVYMFSCRVQRWSGFGHLFICEIENWDMKSRVVDYIKICRLHTHYSQALSDFARPTNVLNWSEVKMRKFCSRCCHFSKHWAVIEIKDKIIIAPTAQCYVRSFSTTLFNLLLPHEIQVAGCVLTSLNGYRKITGRTGYDNGITYCLILFKDKLKCHGLFIIVQEFELKLHDDKH